MTHRSKRFHAGFTLVEVMVTVTIIAILSVIVVPNFQDDDQLRLMAASAVLCSDIEYAQVLNITHPDEPVVVVFDPDNARYWLAYADTPTSPLLREDTGESYLVEMGVGRARSAVGVVLSIVDIAGNTLAFDAQGALADFTSAPLVQLTRGSRFHTIAIAGTTGSITEASGTTE